MNPSDFPNEDDEFYDDDEDFEDCDSGLNCGWTPRDGGGCMEAGTEYCDWECPFNADMMADLERRRR